MTSWWAGSDTGQGKYNEPDNRGRRRQLSNVKLASTPVWVKSALTADSIVSMTVRDLRLLVWGYVGHRVAFTRRESDWLVESVLGISRIQMLARSEDRVADRLCSRALNRATLAARGWPLQYVIGTIPFHGVNLRVSPSVLVPRPETEELVEHVRPFLSGQECRTVIDVCSGSGCIALSVKALVPQADVIAIEKSEGALAVAVENGARLGALVRWVQGDVLGQSLDTITSDVCAAGMVDVVVSNPPYIDVTESSDVATDVLRFEPIEALIVHGDALAFYRKISVDSTLMLRAGGLLAFEVHEDRARAVAGILEAAGFTEVAVIADASRRPRFVTGRRGG